MRKPYFFCYNDIMKNYYKHINPNPAGKSVGDCTVRAIAIATGKSWDRIYWEICEQGFNMCDMPSANHVWGQYLINNGFRRTAIGGGGHYTVRDFCMDNPRGTFVLACSGHVVAVKGGSYCDSWDSGDITPLYCYERMN